MDYSKENKESFMERIEGRFSPTEQIKIELAYKLAKDSHRGQFRKELNAAGDPLRYFEHVRRVALIYIDNRIQHNNISLCCEDIVIALLHDSLEDTRDITPAMIELIFGIEVARRVVLLTKNGKEGYLSRIKSDDRVLFIKMCDRLDNVRNLRGEEVGEEFRVKQKIETREKYLPLFISLNKELYNELVDLTKKS